MSLYLETCYLGKYFSYFFHQSFKIYAGRTSNLTRPLRIVSGFTFGNESALKIWGHLFYYYVNRGLDGFSNLTEQILRCNWKSRVFAVPCQ